MWNPFSDISQGAVKGFGEAIKDAVSAFKADPTQVAQLEQAVVLASLQVQTSVIQAVNQTMQVEAKSEHWMQWSWRPTFGFTGASILINNYILVPYFVKYGVVIIPVPMEVWMMLMAVLGVAAWTRGQEKIEQVKS